VLSRLKMYVKCMQQSQIGIIEQYYSWLFKLFCYGYCFGDERL